ncbi:MAG: CarD family transcriptional regulator, partial [Erythrobacter sp.]
MASVANASKVGASTVGAFTVGDYVVYPKHGVGRVIELQSEEIAGMKLELYVLRSGDGHGNG